MKIITGTGRSGTSITAKIFRDKGYGIGHKVHWYGYRRAGLEAPSVVGLNKHLAHAQRIWEKTGDILPMAETVTANLDTMKRVAETTEVSKDPLYTYTLEGWIKAGIEIEHVFVCMREFDAVLKSAVETGAGLEGAEEKSREENYTEYAKRMGRLFYWLHKYNVPYSVIRYEHYVEDWPEEVTGISKEYVQHVFKPREK